MNLTIAKSHPMQKFHYVHRVDIGKKVLYLLCYVREFVVSDFSLYRGVAVSTFLTIAFTNILARQAELFHWLFSAITHSPRRVITMGHWTVSRLKAKPSFTALRRLRQNLATLSLTCCTFARCQERVAKRKKKVFLSHRGDG